MKKLFLKRNGCNPCNRVKQAIDLESLTESGFEIVYLDELTPEEFATTKYEYELKTVPTYLDEVQKIADSARIIELLKPGYGR